TAPVPEPDVAGRDGSGVTSRCGTCLTSGPTPSRDGGGRSSLPRDGALYPGVEVGIGSRWAVEGLAYRPPSAPFTLGIVPSRRLGTDLAVLGEGRWARSRAACGFESWSSEARGLGAALASGSRLGLRPARDGGGC